MLPPIWAQHTLARHAQPWYHTRLLVKFRCMLYAILRMLLCIILRTILDGQVDFEYETVFSGNKVLTDGDLFARDGGGLCVAPRGEVSFDDYVYFMENEAESGGQGGAVSNSGFLVFRRASYFVSNTAKGESCLQEGERFRF